MEYVALFDFDLKALPAWGAFDNRFSVHQMLKVMDGRLKSPLRAIEINIIATKLSAKKIVLDCHLSGDLSFEIRFLSINRSVKATGKIG